MNRRSRSLRRRRGARQSGGAPLLAGLALALRDWWGHPWRPRRLQWAAVSALTLGVMAAVLVLAPASQAAPHLAAERAATLPASPPPAPDRAQWTDPSGALFVVQFTPAQSTSQTGFTAVSQPAANFSFTLPSGDTVIGYVPIQGSDGSGMDTQVTDTGGGTNFACGIGTLMSAAPYAAGKQVQPTTEHPDVAFGLSARFDPDGLVAYAQLVYADPAVYDPALDGGIANLLCHSGIVAALQQNDPNLHIGTVVSGCPDMISPCQQPLDTAVASVQTFDNSFIAGDWAAVYKETTGLISGQYSEPAFATAMMAQLNSAGKIASLSPVTTPPQVQIGTVGQPFFTVHQTATISKGGKTSTRQLTSYFLLEQGNWLFWFSD